MPPKIAQLCSNILNTLHSLGKESFTALLDFLYPRRCYLCGQFHQEYLCGQCTQRIERMRPPYCERCTQPGYRSICPLCQEASEPTFKKARVVGPYSGTLRSAILHFKFHQKYLLAEPLALLFTLEPEIHHLILQSDLLVPIPITRRSWKQRGFNQSQLLAEFLGKQYGIPVKGRVVKRVKETQPQVGLSNEERRVNVKGAFMVTNPSEIQGRRILLLDDVITTTSTVSEVSRVLLLGGAKEVNVIALARD